MKYLEEEKIQLDFDSFSKLMFQHEVESDDLQSMNYALGYHKYTSGSQLPRLYRIIKNLFLSKINFNGPSLDVSSSCGFLFPFINNYFSSMKPYIIAEFLQINRLKICKQSISAIKFECDKDILPLHDNYLNTIFFFDVIEHLIIDPMWTFLEFNRTMKEGGFLVVTTPNAIAITKIWKVFHGICTETDSELIPISIYQRHNKEWSPNNLKKIMECSGFEPVCCSTNYLHFQNDFSKNVINFGIKNGYITVPEHDLGPELFMIGKKVKHVTLKSNLPREQRWPEGIYSSYEGFQNRPKAYPNLIGDIFG
jgi:Methyltransferase domain